MDESAYQRWWRVHVRVARGEPLGREERELYEAARRELDETEILQPIDRARRARQELRALEAERGRLEQRRQQLDAEIAALESRLAQSTRQLLGAEE